MSDDRNNGSLRVEKHGAVLRIEIDRPAKRNALSEEVVVRLAELVSVPRPDIRCVVLSARGEHFSAGLDLSELVLRDAYGGMQHSRLWHRCLDSIQFGPTPVVAALQGAVIGGGLEVAAAAHIRVADTTTFYALPEGARGMYIGGGGSARLPRLIGVARMTDMMLTGRVLDANEGQQIGLSQYLVEPGTAIEKAMSLAARIAENTTLTNFALTQVLPRIADSSQEVGLLTESLIAGMAQSDPAAKQRLEEFLDGRSARVKDLKS